MTNATGANRIPHFLFTTVAGNVIETWSATAITASLTTAISVAHHPAPAAGLSGNALMVAMPDEIYLPEGATITTVTAALVAADNYGAAVILVEEFLV